MPKIACLDIFNLLNNYALSRMRKSVRTSVNPDLFFDRFASVFEIHYFTKMIFQNVPR
jgi:hypothetical protein